jgi:hypothetical protein
LKEWELIRNKHKRAYFCPLWVPIDQNAMHSDHRVAGFPAFFPSDLCNPRNPVQKPLGFCGLEHPGWRGAPLCGTLQRRVNLRHKYGGQVRLASTGERSLPSKWPAAAPRDLSAFPFQTVFVIPHPPVFQPPVFPGSFRMR